MLNRKVIYFIWVRLKRRKVELKQRVKVQENMVACFNMIVDTTSDLFSQTQSQVFLEFQRIKAFQTLHQGV